MPIESQLPSFEVPTQDIFSFIFDRKDKPFADDKVILRDPYTGRTYTFAQTKNAVVEFGKGLRGAWEWKKRESLCIFSPNSIDTPIIMWGTLWAGGIVSPANPGYTVDELVYQLKDSNSQAIVTQKALLPTVLEAASRVGIPQERIILIGDEKDPEYKFKHFTSVRNLAGTSRFRKAKIDVAKDVAFLPYSSGTTGKPKGVMLSHQNITSNVLQNLSVEGQYMSATNGRDKQGDRIIGCLPFFHIYGLTVMIHFAFYGGFELNVMPRFDIENFCKIVQDRKITMVHVAPPIVVILSKSPVVDKYNLNSLRMLNCGAAPLTSELVQDVWKRLRIPIKQGYGLTETSPTTHVQPWDRWETAMGSAGMQLPNLSAKFMTPEEKEVGIGETGELWVKGPNIFLGYLNNPEGTKNALTPDGWFKTGDVGHIDKETNLYITDRAKELIKYKGFQVPPAELEGKLLGLPQVADCVVIGVYKKDEATEVPRAYVVPKGDPSEALAGEISGWVKKNMANHKHLRGGVRFIKEVPKSPSGKILRRLVRDQAQKEEEGGKSKL